MASVRLLSPPHVPAVRSPPDLLVLVPLFVVAGFAPSLSAAEPVRQQDLRALSAAEAKTLVDHCRGKGYIALNSLQSLSAEAAAELAQHGEYLAFASLDVLSDEAAEALAPFTGRLNLESIEELSDAAAAGLGRCRAKAINLPRLTTLSPTAQERLGQFQGGLAVPKLRTLVNGPLAERLVASKSVPMGVVEISTDAARALARLPGNLHLDTLESISADAAAFLADRPAGGLTFRAMRSLPPDVARALVRTPGSLGLDGLESISAEVAAILAPRAGGLSLARLREVPHPALMDRLVKRNGLRGVRTLPDDVFATIAAMPGERTLDGLRALSDAQAELLGRHEGPLSLNGVTTLSDEAARSLLRHRGPLQLAALRDVSDETLDLVLQHEHLGPRWVASLRSLSPRLARGLVTSRHWDGSLIGITAFESPDSVEIAEILSTRQGSLQIPNLKRASPRTLSALLDARDVAIPLVQTLELIAEPDGGPNDDFVVPKSVEDRQNRSDR